jgi:hypothetical protein
MAGGAELLSDWLRAGQAAHQISHSAHTSSQMPPPEPDRWTNYKPRFFSGEQFRILDSFTAILIPTDETPGAREAHVAPFIDFVVNAAAEYSPEMQQQWRTAMDWLQSNRFGELSGAEQEAVVVRIARGKQDGQGKGTGFEAYRLIKQMTVHAYYTSQAGLIENLQYKGNAHLTEFPGCTHPEHHGA